MLNLAYGFKLCIFLNTSTKLIIVIKLLVARKQYHAFQDNLTLIRRVRF